MRLYLFLPICMLLVACGPKVAPNTFRALTPLIGIESLLVPSSGIAGVSDVKFMPRGGTDYEFAAASTRLYNPGELQAVIYCAASNYGKQLGYSQWYPQSQTLQVYGGDTQVMNVIVTYVTQLPAGVSQEGSKKDWCSSLQQGAL